MNKKIFFFLILFASVKVFAQHGFSPGNNPHDSLLFDGGSFYKGSGDGCNPDTNCEIMVWSVKGTVTGTVIWTTMEPDGCGTMGKFTHCARKQLTAGDRLKPGDDVTTGTDGEVELRVKIKTGYYFRTSMSLPGVARTDQIRIPSSSSGIPSCPSVVKRGRVWIHEEVEEAGKNINESIDNAIESVKSKIKPKGTQLTIEAADNEDIIKVYDGSVEVTLKKYDDSGMKNNSDALKQLYEDYKNGKISQEEMIKKSKEMTDNLKNGVNDFKMNINVDAGYMVKAGGKLSEVIPIPADDDKWWSDERFGK
jgi:hypothetical protein